MVDDNNVGCIKRMCDFEADWKPESSEDRYRRLISDPSLSRFDKFCIWFVRLVDG